MNTVPDSSNSSGFVRWYKSNPWVPVAASMVAWVGSSFLNTGGSAWILSLAAMVALGFTLVLLGAVKIADYVSGGGEAQARLRGRNVAIALALVLFVGIFYAATIVRMGNSMAAKPLPNVVGEQR